MARRRYRGLEAPTDPHHLIGDQFAITPAQGAHNGFLLWHLCPVDRGWVATSTGLHTVTDNAFDPLDPLGTVQHLWLDPSLHFTDCCGLHGWMKAGEWHGV